MIGSFQNTYDHLLTYFPLIFAADFDTIFYPNFSHKVDLCFVYDFELKILKIFWSQFEG